MLSVTSLKFKFLRSFTSWTDEYRILKSLVKDSEKISLLLTVKLLSKDYLKAPRP